MIVGYIIISGLNKPVYWLTTGSDPVTLSLVSDIGTGTSGFAVGINNSGRIVGYIEIGGLDKPVSWATTGSDPVALSLVSNIGTSTRGVASGINDEDATSNI